jgi:hypothetical protein
MEERAAVGLGTMRKAVDDKIMVGRTTFLLLVSGSCHISTGQNPAESGSAFIWSAIQMYHRPGGL